MIPKTILVIVSVPMLGELVLVIAETADITARDSLDWRASKWKDGSGAMFDRGKGIDLDGKRTCRENTWSGGGEELYSWSAFTSCRYELLQTDGPWTRRRRAPFSSALASFVGYAAFHLRPPGA